MRILFLTQVLPYPLDTGAKVRAYYVLRYLAQQHEVTLVSFVRADDPPEAIAHLQSFLVAVHVVPMVRSRQQDALAVPAALLHREPVVIARDRVPDMYKLLAHLVDGSVFDAVHADQTSMVQYALWCAKQITRQSGRAPLRVLDAHNALYLVVQRLADQAQQPALRTFLRWEAKRLQHYERATYQEFDRVVFVTDEDRLRLLIDSATVIPICVDPESTPPVQRDPEALGVTFVGALHWPPNAQGITWFARESWPAVHAAVPQAQLTIIGKAPPPEVCALAQELPNVSVTGYAADLQPYLAQTGVFVVPLLAGGGMRVKIIDAWMWQLPVVATSIGAEGIRFSNGADLLIADDPTDLARAVIHLLSNPVLANNLARAGRQTAEVEYGWQRAYAGWSTVYQAPGVRS